MIILLLLSKNARSLWYSKLCRPLCDYVLFVGAAPGLEASYTWRLLLRHVAGLLHRIRLGRLLPALRGRGPTRPLYPLHSADGVQPAPHGLDGVIQVHLILGPASMAQSVWLGLVTGFESRPGRMFLIATVRILCSKQYTVQRPGVGLPVTVHFKLINTPWMSFTTEIV